MIEGEIDSDPSNLTGTVNFPSVIMDACSPTSPGVVSIFLPNIIIVLGLVARLYLVFEYIKLLVESIIFAINELKLAGYWIEKFSGSRDEHLQRSDIALVDCNVDVVTGLAF